MLTSSGHQMGIATCSACHATLSLALSKEGLGGHSHKSGSSSGFFHSKTLPLAGPIWVGPWGPHLQVCDLSAVSGAEDGGREPSVSMGCNQSAVSVFASVSESKLDSSKVTHLLGHTGLVDGTCLHLGSIPSAGPSLGAICAQGPAGGCLMHGSLNGLNFKTASATVQNVYCCQRCPWEIEWLNLSIWSSNKTAATNAWWWASHMTAKASWHVSWCLFLSSLYVTCTLVWNSGCAGVLVFLIPVVTCLHSSSSRVGPHLCHRHSFNVLPGSLCGSLVPCHGNRVLLPGFSLIGILDGIVPGSLPLWPYELRAPWLEPLLMTSLSGNDCLWAWQTPQLYSFCPTASMHGQTFSDRDMGGEDCWAPTWGFQSKNRFVHQVSIQPL